MEHPLATAFGKLLGNLAWICVLACILMVTYDSIAYGFNWPTFDYFTALGVTFLLHELL